MGIQRNVLAHIKQHQPVTSSEIFTGMTDIETPKQLSQALYVLRSDGKINKGPNNDITITAIGENTLSGNPIAKAAPPKKKNKKAIEPKYSKIIEQNKPSFEKTNALENMVLHTQCAIHEYLRNVGDTQITSTLIAANESAINTLKAHRQEQP